VSERTELATKIVRALWPSERCEQVLDARVELVRGVLEREEKMEKKEPSELARKIAHAVHINAGSYRRGVWVHTPENIIAEIVSDNGLSDLEAKLEAAEKLAHDRLNEIIEISHDLHIKLEAAECGRDGYKAMVCSQSCKMHYPPPDGKPFPWDELRHERDEALGRLKLIAELTDGWPGDGSILNENTHRRVHRLATEKDD